MTRYFQWRIFVIPSSEFALVLNEISLQNIYRAHFVNYLHTHTSRAVSVYQCAFSRLTETKWSSARLQNLLSSYLRGNSIVGNRFREPLSEKM